MSRPLSVAILGSRGIPGRYSGFETLAEELSTRLVERGWRVTVYCRPAYTPSALRSHRGVEITVLPTARSKYLDTPVHTLLSCLHAARRSFDAVLMVNSANALFLPILRAAGIPVAINVDGLDRQRKKWGWAGRAVFGLCERLAVRWSDALIADAAVIGVHYREKRGARPVEIAYGVEPRPLPPGPVMNRLGLEPRRYFLYVGRFERENNPHRVAEAYRGVGGRLPLVMVGGAPYARRFMRSFIAGADPRILFPGPIYGAGYQELLSHALAYVQASEVGGTHPALVEAMGHGNCVIVNDVPEHREVVGDTGRYYRIREPETLAAALEWARREPGAAAELGRRAAARARRRYTWEKVVDRYEVLLESLATAAEVTGVEELSAASDPSGRGDLPRET
ncbi:MAG: glycosyltransferase [Thermoanaerobaculia bacterium]|nr:glycosyltransferase [Thermoanaerobaculia bacterium]